MRRHQQKGFTLIEALIGMLILGMIILVWMSLEVFTAKTVRKVSDFSATQKVIVMIMNDILTAEKGLPPLDPPAALAKAAVSHNELTAVFSSMVAGGMTKKLCYDRSAVMTMDPKFCHYVVQYFKYRVDDRAFAGSQLGNIPLSRVIVQVTYKDLSDAKNQDADPTNDVVQNRYLTRLVSNVAEF